MNEYNYEMVIYYEKDSLVGVMYDNKKNVICKSGDISFWLKHYNNILSVLDDYNSLYIYFNPLLNEYKGLIINYKHDYYNKYNPVQIKEVNGNNLKNCLDKLELKIGLEFVKILTRNKNKKYLKK